MLKISIGGGKEKWELNSFSVYRKYIVWVFFFLCLTYALYAFECELTDILFNLDPNVMYELFRSKYIYYEEK